MKKISIITWLTVTINLCPFWGFAIQTQIDSFSCALRTTSFCSILLDFFFLNSGNFWQFGQYHTFGTLEIFKHEGRKREIWQDGLEHFSNDSPVSILQKHTALRPVDCFSRLLFLVYHLPKISGSTQYLQNCDSFGTLFSQCSLSCIILSLINEPPLSLKPQTMKSQNGSSVVKSCC